MAGDRAPIVTEAYFLASVGIFGIVSILKRKEVVKGIPNRDWRIESYRGDLRAVRVEKRMF